MPLFASIASLCRNLVHKGRVEQDLADEVSSYVDLATQSKMREGLSETDARRAALVELGGTEQVKEQVRNVRMGLWDLRRHGPALFSQPALELLSISS